jgi:hypothetical protein
MEVPDVITQTFWASEDEQFESWLTDVVGHVHCRVCGSPSGLCYRICPNHPEAYTAEREREDALWQESLSQGEYMSLAVAAYERAHGEGS